MQKKKQQQREQQKPPLQKHKCVVLFIVTGLRGL